MKIHILTSESKRMVLWASHNCCLYKEFVNTADLTGHTERTSLIHRRHRQLTPLTMKMVICPCYWAMAI